MYLLHIFSHTYFITEKVSGEVNAKFMVSNSHIVIKSKRSLKFTYANTLIKSNIRQIKTLETL